MRIKESNPKLKRWRVERIVREVYEVLAHDQRSAITASQEKGDPSEVFIVTEKAKLSKGQL